ncbi:MAG: hypothetical protein ACKPKO_17925, partial [Candidatus Fonsibacter sp.]
MTGILQVTPETPQAPAPQPVRRRLKKPLEETPQSPAPQPVRRRLRKPIEETPPSPAPQPVRRRLRKPIGDPSSTCSSTSSEATEEAHRRRPLKHLLHSGLESLQSQQSNIYYLHREVRKAAHSVLLHQRQGPNQG